VRWPLRAAYRLPCGGTPLMHAALLWAVAVTLLIASRTFREIRNDRRSRIRPLVVFEPGGKALATIRRIFNHRIGGINPAFVEAEFASLPESASALDVSRNYGDALNLGVGAALLVKTIWLSKRIMFPNDSFVIDTEKLTEPRYKWGIRSTDKDSNDPCLDFDSSIVEIDGVIENSFR
jgi:hypothetical protein